MVLLKPWIKIQIYRFFFGGIVRVSFKGNYGEGPKTVEFEVKQIALVPNVSPTPVMSQTCPENLVSKIGH